MLAVPGIRKALAAVRERVVAVSPLIAGRAVKGPLAAMLRSLGHRVDVASIAALYCDVASALVVSTGDAPATAEPKGRTAKTTSGRVATARRVAIIEHDILIVDPRRAERLARQLVEPTKPRRAQA
jgi:LPPG:FO 2-phospho-L-lactate transferase